MILRNFRFDCEILPIEMCNSKLIVVLSLTQHISKTTVEPKRGRQNEFTALRKCSHSFRSISVRIRGDHSHIAFSLRSIPLSSVNGPLKLPIQLLSKMKEKSVEESFTDYTINVYRRHKFHSLVEK